MGDINISPEDCDIGIGEENRKRWLKTGKCASCRKARMAGYVEELGPGRSFGPLNPEVNDRFSWFDYRAVASRDTPPSAACASM